jgi:hypothetical protein
MSRARFPSPQCQRALGALTYQASLQFRHGGHTIRQRAGTGGGKTPGPVPGIEVEQVDIPVIEGSVTHGNVSLGGAHHGGQPYNVKTDLSAVRTVQQALDSAENLAEMVAELTAPGGKTLSCDRDGE